MHGKVIFDKFLSLTANSFTTCLKAPNLIFTIRNDIKLEL